MIRRGKSQHIVTGATATQLEESLQLTAADRAAVKKLLADLEPGAGTAKSAKRTASPRRLHVVGRRHGA